MHDTVAPCQLLQVRPPLLLPRCGLSPPPGRTLLRTFCELQKKKNSACSCSSSECLCRFQFSYPTGTLPLLFLSPSSPSSRSWTDYPLPCPPALPCPGLSSSAGTAPQGTTPYPRAHLTLFSPLPPSRSHSHLPHISGTLLSRGPHPGLSILAPISKSLVGCFHLRYVVRILFPYQLPDSATPPEPCPSPPSHLLVLHQVPEPVVLLRPRPPSPHLGLTRAHCPSPALRSALACSRPFSATLADTWTSLGLAAAAVVRYRSVLVVAFPARPRARQQDTRIRPGITHHAEARRYCLDQHHHPRPPHPNPHPHPPPHLVLGYLPCQVCLPTLPGLSSPSSSSSSCSHASPRLLLRILWW